MSFRKENIPLPKEFPIDIFRSEGVMENPPVLHFHDCLEINYIEAGTGTNVIENKKYELTPGDFYIINNLEHHMGVSKGNLKMLVIVFDPAFIWQSSAMDHEYLKPFFNRSIYFSNKIGKDNIYYSELVQIIRKLDLEWNNKEEGYSLFIKAHLMNLLALLYRHFNSKDDLCSEVTSFRKSYDRIRDAVEYINCNYNKKLTLEEMAHVALMNKTYFSSYFKNVMNVNLSEYIESLRINNACLLLKSTEKSITDIAEDCGFSSISYFNKVFKKCMKLSPNEYRMETE